MTAIQIDLCSLLLREYYGEVAQTVSRYLLKKGASPMRLVAQETSLKVEQVKKALCMLIHQNMVSFEENKRGFVEYSFNTNEILLRSRFQHYIYCAKTLYGDAAELIIEEILQHGKVEMSRVVEKATERLQEALEGEQAVSSGVVKEKFVCLAQTHFIQRCPKCDVSDSPSREAPVPNLSITEDDLYRIPDIHVKGGSSKKRKRSIDDDPQSSKKLKTEDSTESEVKKPDEGILWKVDYERFHQYMRDQALVSAVANKIDKKAAEVVRTILRLSEVHTPAHATVTTPLSCNEIHKALPKELAMSRQVLDQYLTLLVDDTMQFILKTGDSGGGMYAIDIKKGLQVLAQCHIESVVQERFGSKCLRIFRLLIIKKQLEQKQIEEFSMTQAKEAKEMLYTMFAQGFVSLTEVPRTPDHAPSRTFYLFSVDINQVSRMLLDRSYKALANLIRRREFETKENKRLLDKHQRVEAIIASLEQSGADQAQKDEIQDMITPPERTQLAKVKHMTNKLEQSEIQLDDTIFTLQTYLYYAHLS